MKHDICKEPIDCGGVYTCSKRGRQDGWWAHTPRKVCLVHRLAPLVLFPNPNSQGNYSDLSLFDTYHGDEWLPLPVTPQSFIPRGQCGCSNQSQSRNLVWFHSSQTPQIPVWMLFYGFFPCTCRPGGSKIELVWPVHKFLHASWLIDWLLIDYWLYPKMECISMQPWHTGQNKQYKPQTQKLSKQFTHCTQVQKKQHVSRARFWLVLSKDWQPQKASECPAFISTHLHQTQTRADFSNQCCVESQSL